VGFDARVEDEPAVLEWFGAKAVGRGDLAAVDRFLETGRYLDASLLCLGLLDRPEQERAVRLRLLRIEAAGIVALGSVEVAWSDRKVLDAWLRVREASVQYAWLPVGERLRRRMGELEADPRVRKSRGRED